MFTSALWRLTAWYLLIIMIISIGFSVSLFSLSSKELSQRLRRQTDIYQQLIAPGHMLSAIVNARDEALAESREALLLRLIYLNIGVLVAGGAGSFWMARRTLLPIKAAHEAQARFTSDASHELRTPLTVLRTEIEVALRSKQLTKGEAVTLLISNLEEVEKLKYLTDALLKISRGDQLAGQQLRRVKVEPVVAAAVKNVAATTRVKQIKIVNAVAGGTVNALGPELTEVVTILLDNALKYSESGSVVKVTSRRTRQTQTIAVTDTGIGIRASDLPHIFDRFYRADNARTKTSQAIAKTSQTVAKKAADQRESAQRESAGGYGLGLAIAKQLVELMRGELTVESELGHGSTFAVTLSNSKLKPPDRPIRPGS